MDLQHCGRCIVVQRFNNLKELDIRTIADDITFTEVEIEDNETTLSAILRMTNFVSTPTCDEFRNYGKCKPEQKRNFLHGVNSFETSTFSKFRVINRFGFDFNFRIY